MKDGKQVKAPRLGFEQPRIFTPPNRPLTPQTTRGFEVIELAAIVGIKLLPWEKWLLIHALELNEDGTFRFRIVLLLVARQNGKSLVLQLLALWRLFVDASQLVIGTAQSLDIAEEQWAAAVEMAQDNEWMAELIARIDRRAGKYAMKLVGGHTADGDPLPGGRYKVATASRRGGRGLSGDLVILDELREHTNWQAWAAVSKTTLARPLAQIWGASNAGDLASVVLAFLRRQAHAALGNPDGLQNLESIEIPAEFLTEDDDDEIANALGSLGIFEWSAAPGRSKWDRTGWQEANPSMNHDMGDPTKKLTEKAIAAAVATEPEAVVKTEVLCQWLETTIAGPFPPGQWEAALDPQSRRGDGERVTYAVDVSHDRSTAHIAVATRRADGLMHVEIVASRSGTAWILPWFRERVPRDSHGDPNGDPLVLTMQSNGAPVSSLMIDLEAEPGLQVHGWAGAELGKGFGIFWDLVRGFNPDESADPESPAADPEEVREPLIRHRNQPLLDLAAQQTVTKPAGDGLLVDRKASPVDAAPLVAAIGAVWVYFAHAPVPKKRSKYEDEDPITYSEPAAALPAGAFTMNGY